MKTLTRTLIVLLLLHLLFLGPPTLLAQRQTAKATTKQARTSAPADGYSQALKRFDDFVARQMAIDQTPGVSIGFIDKDFIWSKVTVTAISKTRYLRNQNRLFALPL